MFAQAATIGSIAATLQRLSAVFRRENIEVVQAVRSLDAASRLVGRMHATVIHSMLYPAVVNAGKPTRHGLFLI
jgi:hypothetical protein